MPKSRLSKSVVKLAARKRGFYATSRHLCVPVFAAPDTRTLAIGADEFRRRHVAVAADVMNDKRRGKPNTVLVQVRNVDVMCAHRDATTFVHKRLILATSARVKIAQPQALYCSIRVFKRTRIEHGIERFRTVRWLSAPRTSNEVENNLRHDSGSVSGAPVRGSPCFHGLAGLSR